VIVIVKIAIVVYYRNGDTLLEKSVGSV